MITRLYIDVDGVLFGKYGSPAYFQLRPGVNSFLSWCHDNFECWWLTAWFDRANELIQDLYFHEQFPVAHWETNKTEGIVVDEPWLWVDDDLMPEEKIFLHKKQMLHRHIKVNSSGERELEIVQSILASMREMFCPECGSAKQRLHGPEAGLSWMEKCVDCETEFVNHPGRRLEKVVR